MSYIEDFLIHADCDEAPKMFHLWAAYSSLSAVLGRRTWFKQGKSIEYANIYVLFVGGAGCGKTEAMRNVKFLLDAVGLSTTSNCESVENYVHKLAGAGGKVPKDSVYCVRMKWPDGVERKTHQLHIQANEFVNLIRIAPESWVSFLNDVSDQDFYGYETKNGTKDFIEGPYITLLGGIPTDVYKKLQEFDIVNTGFGRRTIFQWGKRRFEDPKPRRAFTEEQEQARTRCIEFLKTLKAREPFEITETPSAYNFYNEWYCKHSTTLEQRATPATHGWLSSKAAQVRKIAMLTAISENRGDNKIHEEDYQIALIWLGELEKTMNMVFGGMGRNELAGITLRVLDYLSIRGPVTLATLIRDFYNDLQHGKGPSEMQSILDHLKATEHVVTRQITYGKSGQVSQIWTTPQAMEAFVALIDSRRDAAIRNGQDPDEFGRFGP